VLSQGSKKAKFSVTEGAERCGVWKWGKNKKQNKQTKKHGALENERTLVNFRKAREIEDTQAVSWATPDGEGFIRS